MVKILSPWLTLVASFLETPQIQSDLAIGSAILTQSAARQEGVFQDSRWQPPLASNKNSATFCQKSLLHVSIA